MEKGLVKVQATELARANSLLSRMVDYKIQTRLTSMAR